MQSRELEVHACTCAEWARVHMSAPTAGLQAIPSLPEEQLTCACCPRASPDRCSGTAKLAAHTNELHSAPRHVTQLQANPRPGTGTCCPCRHGSWRLFAVMGGKAGPHLLLNPHVVMWAALCQGHQITQASAHHLLTCWETGCGAPQTKRLQPRRGRLPPATPPAGQLAPAARVVRVRRCVRRLQEGVPAPFEGARPASGQPREQAVGWNLSKSAPPPQLLRHKWMDNSPT
jgi:hypothetical protein